MELMSITLPHHEEHSFSMGAILPLQEAKVGPRGKKALNIIIIRGNLKVSLGAGFGEIMRKVREMPI